jgi:Protein kinase domain
MFCISCGNKVPAQARFCQHCGTPVNGADPDATALGDDTVLDEGNLETLAPEPVRTPPPTPRQRPTSQPRPSVLPSNPTLSSSDAIGGGRFPPGAMISERYRIVALLGRGGMGEVYRAEDLRLSQMLAIKFLPEALAQDQAALARFHSEVRVARQVSHPNVCRVFDIGDADGMPFLTMEYVDGEDLACLLRRIGRLPQDKAIEISRQICAGLAAAHERGVVHRDLKPANIMLDGSGRARLMDFGLAGIAATIAGSEVRAGTPAYMAPEQLDGKEVTAKSDIFSLGLVMYELLTGRRVYDASSIADLMKSREGAITNPSTIVKDLDPLLERVILRCLEKDPAKRPASALQVSAALPGGDPLAAALAAGETPSPEMVAAAGATEGMRPELALGLLAFIVAGLFASLIVADGTQLVNETRLEYPPEVLAARAREVIQKLGINENRVDSAYGFNTDTDYLNYVQQHDKTKTRWRVLQQSRPAPLLFWYRQSPRVFEPGQFFGGGTGGGSVTPDDPPMTVTGMVSVVLDAQGHLVRLRVVSPQQEPPAKSAPQPDWSSLFAAAALDPSSYKSSEPEWTPLAWGDSRAAWSGTLPGQFDLPIRIEAAGNRGQPIYFDLLFPWSQASRDHEQTVTTTQNVSAIVFSVLFVLVLGVAVWATRSNVKQNRADLRGAARLGIFIFVTALLIWLLRAHHVADFYEIVMLLIAVAWGLLLSFFVVLFYMALEPFVRRRDPHILISWTRLLAGQLRDPLVGRDVLIGVVYGVALILFETSDNWVLPLFGKLPPIPGTVSADSLVGIRQALALLPAYVVVWTFYSLCVFFILFLLQRLLRKTWLAVIVVAAIGTFFSFGQAQEYPLYTTVALVVLYVSFLLVLKRFGLLPLVVGLLVQNILIAFPATIHFSRWYAAPSLTGFGAIAILTIYGFRVALAGRPLFSPEALDR